LDSAADAERVGIPVGNRVFGLPGIGLGVTQLHCAIGLLDMVSQRDFTSQGCDLTGETPRFRQ
jgi:hypothetical protein